MSITDHNTNRECVDIDPKTLKELNDPANRVTREVDAEWCVYTVYKGDTDHKIATLTIDTIEDTCFYTNHSLDGGGLLYDEEVYLSLLEKLRTRSNTNTK